MPYPHVCLHITDMFLAMAVSATHITVTFVCLLGHVTCKWMTQNNSHQTQCLPAHLPRSNFIPAAIPFRLWWHILLLSFTYKKGMLEMYKELFSKNIILNIRSKYLTGNLRFNIIPYLSYGKYGTDRCYNKSENTTSMYELNKHTFP